jgi:hypothetical protein
VRLVAVSRQVREPASSHTGKEHLDNCIAKNK